METLLARVTYIAFGLIVIVVGGVAFLWPDKTRRSIQSRQVVESAKESMDSPVYVWVTCLGGLGVMAFGANLIFKAITTP